MTVAEYSQANQDTLVVLLTKEKKNGWYVEIGANDPIITSNTCLLEDKYQWKGLMVEWDQNFLPAYRVRRPLASYLMGDASTFKYDEILHNLQFPSKIDYLQIDLDVDNRSTLTTLEIFDRTVFDKYTFGVVTFEHDIYRGNFFNTQEESRTIFEKHGYVRLFSNVSVFFENQWCAFEDWYAHPTLIDNEWIQKIVNHPNNKETIDNAVCIDIVQSVKNQLKKIVV